MVQRDDLFIPLYDEFHSHGNGHELPGGFDYIWETDGRFILRPTGRRGSTVTVTNSERQLEEGDVI